MASSRRTYDTDSITLRTVFAKNPDNTNVPALRALTADGLGGAYWAIPSSLGGIPAYNRIVTSAGSYTADLSFNTFRLLAGQNIGMVDGPAGSNQTTLFGKSFSQFDISGENTLVAFANNLLTPSVRFAGQGGIQITGDPATNTLVFNGSAVVTNISTGIYGFNQIKVTPTSSTITSSLQEFGGDFITASSPSTLLRFLGYNDIQLSTNVTTNSVFFTISTFTSKGYLDISANAYGAYPSSISTASAILTSSLISSTQYFQSVNQVNLSSVYSSINGLAMSTGAQFYLLTGLINARATIIQLNDEVADLNSNIQSTSVGLGTIGYISSSDSIPGLTDLQLISTLNNSPNLTNLAIGYQSGKTSQQANAVAIGVAAGSNTQGDSAIAIGNSPGFENQSQYAIAIGVLSGYDTQGQDAIAIGRSAGYSNQQQGAIAIGYEAGRSNQGPLAIAVGETAGYSNQSDLGIAIGNIAGSNNQGVGAIAIGFAAGQSNQGTLGIAIGYSAGLHTQQPNSIAIGFSAGHSNQGPIAVALGSFAGYSNQGSNSVALGNYAGYNNQSPSSIIINALGSNLNATNPGLYVAPLRDITGTETNALAYNALAFELGTTNTMTLSNLNVSSVMETTSNRKVNVAALWSTFYTLYPACFE